MCRFTLNSITITRRGARCPFWDFVLSKVSLCAAGTTKEGPRWQSGTTLNAKRAVISFEGGASSDCFILGVPSLNLHSPYCPRTCGRLGTFATKRGCSRSAESATRRTPVPTFRLRRPASRSLCSFLRRIGWRYFGLRSFNTGQLIGLIERWERPNVLSGSSSFVCTRASRRRL